MRVFLSGRRRKPCEDGTKRDLKILSTGLEDGARDHETRKTKNLGYGKFAYGTLISKALNNGECML